MTALRCTIGDLATTATGTLVSVTGILSIGEQPRTARLDGFGRHVDVHIEKVTYATTAEYFRAGAWLTVSGVVDRVDGSPLLRVMTVHDAEAA